MEKKVTPKEAVSFLNKLLKDDRKAIESLFAIRVLCNKKLATHPTVQCGMMGKDTYFVGILGILNGLFGKDDNECGFIVACIDNGKIKRFRLVRDTNKGGNKK